MDSSTTNSNTAKRLTLYIISIVLVIIFITMSIFMFTKVYFDAYEHSYARNVVRQYNYLKDTRGKDRIIIVGTSSASFMFDKEAVEMIENATGKKVVVFGNYAAMGNTCFLDWVDDYIQNGDTVIYMYDLHKDAMYVGFDGFVTLQGIYGNLEMFNKLSNDNKSKTIASLPKYLRENTTLYRTRNTDRSTLGVYDLSSFDDRGIMTYKRSGPGVVTVNNIDIYPEMIQSELTDYIATWAKALRKKGASVYFRYGPVIDSAITFDPQDEKVKAFALEWEKQTTLKAMNDISKQYLPAEYFYDGSFHLNSEGAKMMAEKFIAEFKTL